MRKLVGLAMKNVSSFGIFDFGMFKLCLFSFGVIIGAYFSLFFLKYMAIMWVMFIVSWIYLMLKAFKQ